MSKLNLQFHATIEDIYEFVNDLLRLEIYKVCGISFFPGFKLEDISAVSNISDFKRYNMIVVSKNEIIHCNNYNEFMCNQDNNLGITVGYNGEDVIKETAMWINAENEIDKDWKKIVSRYKKSLLTGAWVINPHTNAKAYCKNHRYTVNAKKAYENGVKICPIAGWNFYELVNEQG